MIHFYKVKMVVSFTQPFEEPKAGDGRGRGRVSGTLGPAASHLASQQWSACEGGRGLARRLLRDGPRLENTPPVVM